MAAAKSQEIVDAAIRLCDSGLNYQETSERLGVSAGAVGTWYRREIESRASTLAQLMANWSKPRGIHRDYASWRRRRIESL